MTGHEETAAPPDAVGEDEAPAEPRVRWWHRDAVRQLLAGPPALLGLLVPGNGLLTLLAVWDVFAVVYLLLTWLTFRSRDPAQAGALAMATHRPRRSDRWLAHSPRQIPQSAAGMAIVAVVVLPQLGDQGAPSAVVYVVAVVAVVTSWVVLHVGYMLIYAGLYAEGGGLAFPGGEEPHLVDFGYFAVAVGTTFGTTDVDVTQRRVRRHVLTHGVLSFVFNTLIVAIAVSVSASWIAAR